MTHTEFIGVYSTQQEGIKKAASLLMAPRKKLYFIWKTRDGLYYRQAIDKIYRPKGEQEPLSVEDFNTLYTFESSILATPISRFEPIQSAKKKTISAPSARSELQDSVEEAEHVPTPDEIAEALFKQEEAKKPLTPEEKLERDLREHFALQIAKMRQKRSRKTADEILKIINWKKGIKAEHKHMYTDFGVDLRKMTLHELALQAFLKAKNLSMQDPNAWFNLARIYYEMNNYHTTAKCLEATLEIDPKHREAKALYKHIQKGWKEHEESLTTQLKI